MAFRSHWRLAAEFRTPGEGYEKGSIEGEGGYFRRNHLLPVPGVTDLKAFNGLLLTACRADEAWFLPNAAAVLLVTLTGNQLISVGAEPSYTFIKAAGQGWRLNVIAELINDTNGPMQLSGKAIFARVQIDPGASVTLNVEAEPELAAYLLQKKTEQVDPDCSQDS